MDYKHRVPGNRQRRPARTTTGKGPGLVVGIVIVVALMASGVIWWSHRNQAVSTEPVVEASTKTELSVPPATQQTGTRPDAKKDKRGTKPSQAEATIEKQETTTRRPDTPTIKPVEPRFSFYKILPEKEVIIPDNEIRSIKQEESRGKKPNDTPYVVQAGSYTNLADAENLKTQLSQLKIRSKVESVKIEATVWHRVKIGPFSSVADADKVRTFLRANKIDSVVQKSTGR